MSRVTTADLAFAHEWIGSFDGEGEEGAAERTARLCAWLDAEIKRRDAAAADRAVVSEAVRRSGVSAERARAALKRARARQRAEAVAASNARRAEKAGTSPELDRALALLLPSPSPKA